jgi:hypothetical protein
MTQIINNLCDLAPHKCERKYFEHVVSQLYGQPTRVFQ